MTIDSLKLENRVAIVTGGARGIGYAVAQRVLRSGGSVSLWDRDRDRLQQASADLAALGKVAIAEVELTADVEVQTAIQGTIERFGRIDILVNNAGITGGNGPTWELEPDVWRRVLNVNLIAPFLMCRGVVPHMLRQGYGRIINVASVAGKEGNPNASHYSASKAGLIVNCVTPAAARTAIFEQMKQEHIDYMLSKIPMNRFVEPGEVAALICWLASEECSFSTGAVFDVSGGRATY
jgi:3-oxoacyl-[acyl-carrier protein] reductase